MIQIPPIPVDMYNRRLSDVMWNECALILKQNELIGSNTMKSYYI